MRTACLAAAEFFRLFECDAQPKAAQPAGEANVALAPRLLQATEMAAEGRVRRFFQEVTQDMDGAAVELRA